MAVPYSLFPGSSVVCKELLEQASGKTGGRTVAAWVTRCKTIVARDDDVTTATAWDEGETTVTTSWAKGKTSATSGGHKHGGPEEQMVAESWSRKACGVREWGTPDQDGYYYASGSLKRVVPC